MHCGKAVNRDRKRLCSHCGLPFEARPLPAGRPFLPLWSVRRSCSDSLPSGDAGPLARVSGK
jgi:hypothetical protein